MSIILILSILLLGLIGFLIIEYKIHSHNLYSIPIRIHVNGSRGKSSVTRLIAAGLREQGIKTLAKTTGTLPRVIMDDGTEYPIFRPAGANVIEQVRIVALAADHGACALVIECMALQPYLQALTELKLIRATHGVITNVRPDHLDIMGPVERDVALALLGTTPPWGNLFTCERDYPNEFRSACVDRNCQLVCVSDEEISTIRDEEMSKFSYLEHKDNVALALKVCESLGVNRDTALRGIWKARPDFGALQEYRLLFFGRELIFVNGFAANDPESSEYIWRLALARHEDSERKIMIVNTRLDRPDRSRQLGQAIPTWPMANNYIIIGSGTYQLVRTTVNKGLPSALIINAEGMDTESIFERIVLVAGKSAMIMGIGNIAGPGMELVTWFINRSQILN